MSTCVQAPAPNTPKPTELLRAVSYVCMTPRSKATQEVLSERRQAYTQGVTTTHWPHEFKPTHGAVDELRWEDLSGEQQQLV